MKKLQAYFKKYGVTISAFCRMTGICRASMYAILWGKNPSIIQAIAIEEYSGGNVTIQDWVREAKAKKVKPGQRSKRKPVENQDHSSQNLPQNIAEKNDNGHNHSAL